MQLQDDDILCTVYSIYINLQYISEMRGACKGPGVKQSLLLGSFVFEKKDLLDEEMILIILE